MTLCRSTNLLKGVLTLALASCMTWANAQAPGAASWPVKPITMVVPFPAGGATDILARVIAQRLQATLGQTVSVENKAGAGGSLGADAVAKASNDGHTLLMSTSSTHSIGPAISTKLPYDAFKDFAPIAHVATSANVLVVASNHPAQSAAALVAQLKSNPGKYNFGSSGIGTIPHLSAELFKARAGQLFAVHIPYRGTQQVIPDLISGQIHFLMDSVITAAPHVRDGKLRALAQTGTKRSAALPNVPTFDEVGIAGMDAATWFGLFAPAGTPTTVVERINQLVGQIITHPDVTAQLTRMGADPVGGTAQQFGERVRGDYVKWRDTIQRAGIMLD